MPAMIQGDATVDERTTAELIDTLGEDVDRCFRGMDGSFKRGKKNPDGSIEAKYEYHARQLIRAVFAFIEAVTFSMKLRAAEHYAKMAASFRTPSAFSSWRSSTF